MRAHDTTRQSSSSFGMFMVGAALGSVAALLFAPKSGKELRGDIKTKAQDAHGKAMEKTKMMADRTIEATDKARNKAKGQIDKMADTVEKTERNKIDKM